MYDKTLYISEPLQNGCQIDLVKIINKNENIDNTIFVIIHIIDLLFHLLQITLI